MAKEPEIIIEEEAVEGLPMPEGYFYEFPNRPWVPVTGVVIHENETFMSAMKRQADSIGAIVVWKPTASGMPEEL
jgi:hypothetical protein